MQDILYIRENLRQPIVLVGMMGAGKSRIGALLASALAVPFYDSDHEVTLASGMQVADIFATYGEAAFRDCEEKVLARLVQQGTVSAVIATGGGAFARDETRDLLEKTSLTLWLRAAVPVLLKRVALRADKRPLLAGQSAEAVLTRLLETRAPMYARAAVTVDSHDVPPQETVDAIIKAVAAFLRQKNPHP